MAPFHGLGPGLLKSKESQQSRTNRQVGSVDAFVPSALDYGHDALRSCLDFRWVMNGNFWIKGEEKSSQELKAAVVKSRGKQVYLMLSACFQP